MPTISVNNADLYYVEHGSGDIPIIFVHGFLLSSNMWTSSYLPSLPPRYRAYALDMRGHGRSKDAPDCTIGAMADDVYEFSRTLKLGEFVFAGVSMGGGVGLQLALRHQEALSALVLFSPVTGLGPSGAVLLRLLGGFIAQKRWVLRVMIRGLCVRRPPPQALETVLDDAVLVSAGSIREFTGAEPPITGLERLDSVTVPTLLIIGTEDRAIPVDQQHRLAERMPNVKKVVYEGEGHMVVGERREAVMGEMLGFLDDVVGGDGANESADRS